MVSKVGTGRCICSNITSDGNSRPSARGPRSFPFCFGLLVTVAMATGPGCIARDTGAAATVMGTTTRAELQAQLGNVNSKGDIAKRSEKLGPIADTLGGLPYIVLSLHGSIIPRGVPGPLPLYRDFSDSWYVAQLVERGTVNAVVAGSSPAVPANRPGSLVERGASQVTVAYRPAPGRLSVDMGSFPICIRPDHWDPGQATGFTGPMLGASSSLASNASPCLWKFSSAVEHRPDKPGVVGSNPSTSTNAGLAERSGPGLPNRLEGFDSLSPLH